MDELAQFEGRWRIDADAYTGTMQIDRHGVFLHTTAELTPGETRHGLAIPFAGRLVMAFGPKDKVEIGAYEIAGDTLRGLWVPPGAGHENFDECGREESVGGHDDVW